MQIMKTYLHHPFITSEIMAVSAAAAASSCITSTNFSSSISESCRPRWGMKRDEVLTRKRKGSIFSVSAVEGGNEVKSVNDEKEEEKPRLPNGRTKPRPVEVQRNVESKNMSREYGGQWLSCTTRHVRIYAAYIDPETCAFDQSQMDKLTLMLDPTDEFLWTDDTCYDVYSYFQELVDHYEGAPLNEYTLRLIGSDIEHYIRKMLYRGEIQYNMNARVLNFSMGKPRIGFNYNNGQPQDINL